MVLAAASAAAGGVEEEGDFWDVGDGVVYVLDQSGALLRTDLLLGVLRRLRGGAAVARARDACRSWRAVLSDDLSDPTVDAALRLQRRQEEPRPPRTRRRSGRRAKGDGSPPPRHGRRPRRKPAEFRMVCH
uniref:F-box domain-containing protein n=1 Tax=Oryza barthii TaxID=65489 RepID=A0A0D3GND7_9ORYZ